MNPDNVNVETGKSLQAVKPDEIPTVKLPPLRPDAHVESLMQAMEDINLADLSRDQLKDLPESLLQFHEKLTQKKAEILRRKSESISSD